MRIISLATLAGVLLLLVLALPGPAQNPGGLQYRITIDKVFSTVREKDGQRGLYVTVQFRVTYAEDGRLATTIDEQEIEVREDGQKVATREMFTPRGPDKLTTVLALDTSGSMAEHHKIEEARFAATTFLNQLHEKADSGLILFNHEILQPTLAPLPEPERSAAGALTRHRQELRDRVAQAQAEGGTAYLDATVDAVHMLHGVEGRRAVLLMTDGVDLNSKHNLAQAIKAAQAAEVPVYTLGVGEPGKNEPVSTVMVLDCSGSMNDPADNTDRVSKIDALRQAAARFIDIMRTRAQTKLLPFSSVVDQDYLPRPFSADKPALKADIATLKARGGTALYDATLDGIETLEAARPEGKRAVVVLTDGFDESPGSRQRVEDVIARARETHTPLHMLALGRDGEFNEAVMRRMADAVPGGSFHHVRNQKELLDIFEQLSIDLHDDGIDEVSLRTLAQETGGEYYPAKDVSRLHLIYEQLAEELQSTYTVTFPSRRSSHDGTARGIDISIWRGHQRVSDVATADYTVHGVVVPEMDARVYLVLLALLGCLLVAPSGVRILYRFYGGA